RGVGGEGQAACGLELPDKTRCQQLTEAYVQLEPPEAPAMKLTDFVDDVPADVWEIFEPILPPAVWKGVGCKPYSNRECLHALLYLLITGIGWQFLPKGLPSYKTVQRRLKRWLALDCFHTAWQQLAQRYVRL